MWAVEKVSLRPCRRRNDRKQAQIDHCERITIKLLCAERPPLGARLRTTPDTSAKSHSCIADLCCSPPCCSSERWGWPIGRPAAMAQLESLTGKFAGGGVGRCPDSAKLTSKAVIEPAEANRPAMLVIAAQIAPGWHIYSISQPAGGPDSQQDQAAAVERLPPAGRFHRQARRRGPRICRHLAGREGRRASGKVTWQAPHRTCAGVDPAKSGNRRCASMPRSAPNSCLPPRDYKFVATWPRGSSRGGPDTPGPGLQVGPPANPHRGRSDIALEPARQPPGSRAGSEVLRAGHTRSAAGIEPALSSPAARPDSILTANAGRTLVSSTPWPITIPTSRAIPSRPRSSWSRIPPFTFGRPSGQQRAGQQECSMAI